MLLPLFMCYDTVNCSGGEEELTKNEKIYLS